MQQNLNRMASEEEKKNKRTGMIISIGFHASLLVLFFFLLAWRAPNPPLPDYGIELNFGMIEGSGPEQPTTPPNQSESMEEAAPEETAASEEITEESAAPEELAEPVSEVVPEVTQPAKEVSPTQPTESPVVKKTPEVKKETPKKETKPAEKPVTTPKEDKKVAEKTATKESTTSGADGTTGTNNEPKASGQGNKKDVAGDAGNPEGKVDARALYGTQGGGGGGPALEISGWMWDEAPNNKDASAENGRIVFEFQIDDQGYVISTRTVESTVSPKVLQFYKEQLQSVTFSQTTGSAPPPMTTGKVTFVIKSR